MISFIDLNNVKAPGNAGFGQTHRYYAFNSLDNTADDLSL